MHQYQQKGESLPGFNFEFSELIQAITNYKSKDIIDPLNIDVYAQKLFNLSISAKIIIHALTLQKAIEYLYEIEREFLLDEEIQQTWWNSSEFDTMMPIDAVIGNDLMRKQRIANITF